MSNKTFVCLSASLLFLDPASICFTHLHTVSIHSVLEFSIVHDHRATVTYVESVKGDFINTAKVQVHHVVNSQCSWKKWRDKLQ